MRWKTHLNMDPICYGRIADPAFASIIEIKSSFQVFFFLLKIEIITPPSVVVVILRFMTAVTKWQTWRFQYASCFDP